VAFGRPFNPKQAPPVAFDPTLGQPLVRQAVAAADARDGDGVLAAFAAADGRTRHLITANLEERCGRPGWTDGLVERHPDLADAWLLSGVSLVMWAWEARGRGYASRVAPDAWPLFLERLTAADGHLLHAARLSPYDPEPWIYLQAVGRGLSLDRDEMTRRFHESVRTDRFHCAAVSARLQVLCAKWQGSSREMFDFARAVSVSAPDGHAVHDVIVRAHIEEFLQRRRDGALKPSEYFRAREVAREIGAAADRSVRHRRFGQGIDEVAARNWFALGLLWAGDVAGSHRQFQAIGTRVLPAPWDYFGDVGAKFAEFRAVAGRYGRR
jgi:hypothetical protein